MRYTQLSDRMAEAGLAEQFAQNYFADGKRRGKDIRVADIWGGPGESAVFHVRGPRAGTFKDFATDEGHDMLGILAIRAHGGDIKAAYKAACQTLGIQPDAERFEQRGRRQFDKPRRPDNMRTLQGPPLEWLTATRKITTNAIEAYRVAESGRDVVFPFLVDDEVVMIKTRSIDDKQIRPTSANQQPVLFGWQAIPANAREITICEGEIDALTLFDYGYPALSVPFGGGKGDKQGQWIDQEYERLAVFDTIYLCLDDDEPGGEAAQEILQRLGRERCRIVRLPHKDANACRLADVPRVAIVEAFAKAQTQDPTELCDWRTYEDDVVELMCGDGAGLYTGLQPPWIKLHNRLSFRVGETIMLAGYNGAGKTEAVNQIIASAMADAYRCCVASLEFAPAHFLRKLVTQLGAERYPARAYVGHVFSAFDVPLVVYKQSGPTHIDALLEHWAYARRRWGTEVFVLDNISRLADSIEDMEVARRTTSKIADFSRDTHSITFIVAHARKGVDERGVPGKMDIKGSGAFTDLVDTVLTIGRNKERETQMAKLANEGQTASAEYQELQQQWGAMLACHKQRNGDCEPKAVLWFDTKSCQFVESPTARGRPYVPAFSIHESEGY